MLPRGNSTHNTIMVNRVPQTQSNWNHEFENPFTIDNDSIMVGSRKLTLYGLQLPHGN